MLFRFSDFNSAIMNKQEIIKVGEILSRDLDVESTKYHVKSDQYDILGFESAEILRISKSIESDQVDKFMLSQSTLLSSWGTMLKDEVPNLMLRVKQYRKLCEEYLVKNS